MNTNHRIMFFQGRPVFMAGELEGVKTQLEKEINEAELMQQVDDILQNLDMFFDAKIKDVISGIEAENAKIEADNAKVKNKKDKKPLKDVEAAKAELMQSKESLKGTLQALAVQAKKTIELNAKTNADKLAREVARPVPDADQKKRANESNAGARMASAGGLGESDFVMMEIQDRKGLTKEHWGEDESYAAAVEILTAIYIEQGEDAAKKKAAELKERASGMDIDEGDFADVFKNERTGINFTSRDEKSRIIDNAKDSRLTGRIYGFYYTAGEAFKSKDGAFDNELLDGYRNYLNTESGLALAKIDADESARNSAIAAILSPTQWAQKFHPDALGRLKGTPSKIDVSLDEKTTKEVYINKFISAIPDAKTRETVHSILVGALGASKDRKDWPNIVMATLNRMGATPETIGTINADNLKKLGIEGKYGVLKPEEIDFWVKDYIDGLRVGAKQFYNDEEFLKEYDAYINGKVLGTKGSLTKAVRIVGKEKNLEKTEARRRLWGELRSEIMTPAEFLAKYGIPEEPEPVAPPAVEEPPAPAVKAAPGAGTPVARRGGGGAVPGSGRAPSGRQAGPQPVARGPEAAPGKVKDVQCKKMEVEDDRIGTVFQTDIKRDIGLTPKQKKKVEKEVEGQQGGYADITVEYENGQKRRFAAHVTREGKVDIYHQEKKGAAQPERPRRAPM